MRYKINRKQKNARHCLVCGTDNAFGLQAAFYETESNEVIAVFAPADEHQSYPHRMHGGIASAILDETIGRAVMIGDPDAWGVTIELNLRYRKPVPLGVELKVIGRITADRGRMFEGTGEIVLPDGEVAVTATGKYMRKKLGDITAADFTEADWRDIGGEVPTEIEV